MNVIVTTQDVKKPPTLRVDDFAADSAGKFIKDLENASTLYGIQIDESSEERIRQSFENPFLKVVKVRADHAIKNKLQLANAELIFKSGAKLQEPQGHHGRSESVDGIFYLKWEGTIYVLGLLCCKKNITELNKAPFQGITYLLKILNPEMGLKVISCLVAPLLCTCSCS